MIVNSVNREIPEELDGIKLRPFMGAYAGINEGVALQPRKKIHAFPGIQKLKGTLKEAIIASGLKDGMTISFHHCFREGDKVVGKVLTAIRELGIKGLKFAPSAVVNLKNPSVVDFVKDGTINRIEASGIRGDLGDAVLNGALEHPVILRTHGSRPRAIESGELHIDVAFIGASAADDYGNATGQIGPNACGPLGHSFVDAKYADVVIVVTDNLVPYPCVPASISQTQTDYVVVVDQVGDNTLIGRGAIRVTKNPRDLYIAKMAAQVMEHSGFMKEGFGFQMGGGAISVACTKYLGEIMTAKGVKASFALGGITGTQLDIFKAGYVNSLHAVQAFDVAAAKALIEYPRNVVECDNAVYANPYNKGCMVNKLTFGILGGLEVDTDFNVNILTGSSGEMNGGLGGGPDVAAGAEVSILTIPLFRGRTPSVVKKVFTCCTPGETIAVVVTEAGIALNPKHRSYHTLKENLEKSNLKIYTIEELRQMAEEITGEPKPIKCTDRIVCLVQYRDGSIIDVIRQVEPAEEE